MNKTIKYLVAASFACLPALGVAATDGDPSPGDPRIQIATYSQDEVFNLYVRAGRAAIIQFEDGEDLEGSPVGFGDPDAWDVAVVGNRMLLRPKDDNPDTNVVISTNKRSYVFSLISSKKKKPTYLFRFRYPDTEAAIAAAKLEQEKREEAKRRMLAEAATEARNTNYSMRGDTKIAPSAAWDNGRFTFFEYADNRELPAVFKITADGTEALVNTHMDGPRMVIHETNDIFILRLGQLVLGVYNDSYDPKGQFNAKGTTINAVRMETRDVN